MIVITHARGHLAVSQQAHAEMCQALAEAWGSERFPAVETHEELALTAGGHELGMLEWDREPTLNDHGLPASVKEMGPAEHLPLRRLSVDRLAEQSAYAALICSLHHSSHYERPHPLARLRRRHRLVHDYLEAETERQAALRADLDCDPAVVERDRRLHRVWDRISHALLEDRAPTTIGDIPDGPRGPGAISVRAGRDHLVVDPWPFSSDRIVVGARGRLLERPYEDRAQMLGALAAARELEVTYTLTRA